MNYFSSLIFQMGKLRPGGKVIAPRNIGLQDQHWGYNSLSWLLIHCALWLRHAFCMPCTLFGWPYIKKKKKKPNKKERQQARGRVSSWKRKWQSTPVILAWEIPWTEEPGGLQSMRWQRVRNNWYTNTSIFTFVKLKAKPEGKTAGKNSGLFSISDLDSQEKA